MVHYGEMPRVTVGSSGIFTILENKSFVKFQTSNAYLKKKRSADKKLKNNKKQTAPNVSTSNGIKVEIG